MVTSEWLSTKLTIIIHINKTQVIHQTYGSFATWPSEYIILSNSKRNLSASSWEDQPQLENIKSFS